MVTLSLCSNLGGNDPEKLYQATLRILGLDERKGKCSGTRFSWEFWVNVTWFFALSCSSVSWQSCSWPLKLMMSQAVKGRLRMVGHLFQNYDTIYVRLFPTYTCNHSCYTIYVRFFGHVYLRSFRFVGFLFPTMWPFSYKRAHICAQKSPYISVTNKHVVYGVQRKSSYKRHRIIPSAKKPLHVRWSWKATLVWIKHGRNGRVNFEQGLVLIHCPHSSGGCWLPDNGFVGIRGLSLERLCTLFHKCWPKQRSIQLEISVRQAKHDS